MAAIPTSTPAASGNPWVDLAMSFGGPLLEQFGGLFEGDQEDTEYLKALRSMMFRQSRSTISKGEIADVGTQMDLQLAPYLSELAGSISRPGIDFAESGSQTGEVMRSAAGAKYAGLSDLMKKALFWNKNQPLRALQFGAGLRGKT